MKSFGKVLWKAVDGREFIIDANKLGINSVESLNEHIDKLREKYGYEKPDILKNKQISHFHVLDPAVQRQIEKYKGTIKTEDLPLQFQEKLKKLSIEALNKPDPKKLN